MWRRDGEEAGLVQQWRGEEQAEMGGRRSRQVRWKMSRCRLHSCPAPPVSLKGIPPPGRGPLLLPPHLHLPGR